MQESAEYVSAVTRAILARKPPYGQTTEENNPNVFTTSIRPSLLMLPTKMVVTIEQTAQGTQVDAKTQSQWFILGDVFDYYNKYISDFFEALRAELQLHKSIKQQGEQGADGDAEEAV